MASCITCDTAPPPCLCTETQQCVTIGRSCTECPKNVCRDTAGAGGGGGGGGSNGGAIGGAVGGVIIALCLFGWLYWYFKKRSGRRGPIGLSRGSRKGLKNLSIGGGLYHGRRGDSEKYNGTNRASTEFDSVGTGARTEKATTTSRMMPSDRATHRSSTGLSLGTAGARDGHSDDDHRARKRGSAVLVDMPPSPTGSDMEGDETRERRKKGSRGAEDDPFGDHHSSVAYSERMSVATSKAADVIPIAYIPSHSSTSATTLPTSRASGAGAYAPSPNHLTVGPAVTNKRSPAGPSPLSRGSAVPSIGVVAPSNASEASRLSLPVSELSDVSYDESTEAMSANRHSDGSVGSGGRNSSAKGREEDGDEVVISHVQRVDLSSPSAVSANASLARSGSINNLRRQNSQGHSGVTADGRPIRPPRAPGLDLKLPDQPTPAHAISSPPVSSGPLGPLGDADRPASGFPWGGRPGTGSSQTHSTPVSGRTGAKASTPSAFGPEGDRPEGGAPFSRFSASTIASNAQDNRPLSSASSWVDEALSPTGLRPKDSRYYSRMSDVSAAPSHMSYNIMDPATIVTPMTGATRVQLGGRTEVGRVVQLGRSPSGKTSKGSEDAREELEEVEEEANPFSDNKRASDAASVAEVHIASRVQRSPAGTTEPDARSPAFIDLVGGGGRAPSATGSRRDSYGTADDSRSNSSRPTSTGYAASGSAAPNSPVSARHMSMASETETTADRTSYTGSLGATDGEFHTPTAPSFPMPPIRDSPSTAAQIPDEPVPREDPVKESKSQQSLGQSRAVSQAYSMRSGYSSGGALEGIPFNLAFPSGVESSAASDRGSVWSVASKTPHKHGHGASSSVSSKRTQAHLSVPMTVVSHFDDDEEEERRRVIRGDDDDVPPVPAIPPVPKLPHQAQSQAVHILGSPKNEDKKEELMPLPEERLTAKEEKSQDERRTASGASVRASTDSFMLMAGLAAQFADGE